MRLCEAVAPLFAGVEPLQEALDRFGAVFTAEYDAMCAAKVGLAPGDEAAQALVQGGFTLLHEAEVDFTLFFRALGDIDLLPSDPEETTALLGDVFYDPEKQRAHTPALAAWLHRWHALVTEDGTPFAARRARMHAVNPRYVLRNYLAQQAIDRAESGDPSMIHVLLDVMRRPYDDQPEYAEHAARRPEWAREKAGCSMLSCSS
jgi:uncharacterized protein YdiU (UPF0061 family)